MRHRGEWDLRPDWTPVWIGFGDTWRNGDEPLPWAAHVALWQALESYAEHVASIGGSGESGRIPLPEDIQL